MSCNFVTERSIVLEFIDLGCSGLAFALTVDTDLVCARGMKNPCCYVCTQMLQGETREVYLERHTPLHPIYKQHRGDSNDTLEHDGRQGSDAGQSHTPYPPPHM